MSSDRARPESVPNPDSRAGTARAKAKTKAKSGPRLEALEDRVLLASSVTGNNFALISRPVEVPSEVVQIPVNVTSQHFTMPRGSMILGIDVIDQPGSNLQPRVLMVTDGSGATLGDITGPENRATIVNVTRPRGVPVQTLTLTVAATTANPEPGAVLTGYYLPGDANADGRVDGRDFRLTQALVGAKRGDANYNFDADANRDGVIDQQDLRLLRRNIGVATKVAPMISANLDPASDTGLPDRVTRLREVRFQGAATPGTVMTFTERANAFDPVQVTVGNDGTYQVQIAIADGENRIDVEAADPFGQIFRGALSPVTHDPEAPELPAAPTPAPAPADNAPAGATTANATPGTTTVQPLRVVSPAALRAQNANPRPFAMNPARGPQANPGSL